MACEVGTFKFCTNPGLKIEYRTRQESGYPGSRGSCGAVLNTSENRAEDTRTSGNKGRV